MPYLFVHFREKTTPDGEQVYFSLSRDGFAWEEVNGGAPVLWAYYETKGVRDFTVTRLKNGRFVILATDLSLAYGTREHKQNFWETISTQGSTCLSLWESENLTDWSEQRLVKIGLPTMGCVWAPDVIYDPEHDDYVIHFSASDASDGYREKGIWYVRTRDFVTFTTPQILYKKPGFDIIDSAMNEEDGLYYLFLKVAPSGEKTHIELRCAPSVTGDFTPVPGFEESLSSLEKGLYEAPTALSLPDGRWVLFLDFYGARGSAQGYVPFLAPSLRSGAFTRAEKDFSFPYRFKHGTVLPISEEEYERIKAHDWSDRGYERID